MSITFGQAKATLAQYQGKGGRKPTAEEGDLFTLSVLQYMLYSGSHANLRLFTFNAVNGVFTAPHELETPQKIKIDDAVGNVWSKWYDFYSQNSLAGGADADSLIEDPNDYCTVYDLPPGGARVAVQGMANEECDAHIIVQGRDPTGRDVYTQHDGKEVFGEYLSIKRGTLSVSTVTFGELTGVFKTRTKGYTQLHWVDTEGTMRQFMADYAPVDEVPRYRRFRLTTCRQRLVKLSVLGRIRLKPAYSETDIIPFDNLMAIQTAGQSANSGYNGDLQARQAQDGFMQELLSREAEYKRPRNGQPVECFKATSGGAIKNIVGRGR